MPGVQVLASMGEAIRLSLFSVMFTLIICIYFVIGLPIIFVRDICISIVTLLHLVISGDVFRVVYCI